MITFFNLNNASEMTTIEGLVSVIRKIKGKMGLIYGIANVTLAIIGICVMLVIIFMRTFYALCKKILRE